MTMNNNNIATGSGSGLQRKYRDVSPTEEAAAELTWYFNDAPVAGDPEANQSARLLGSSIVTLDEVERHIEARHSALKISDRLRRLDIVDAFLLMGLFTERYWSDAVEAALPGGLAGAAAMAPRVRVEQMQALARGQTKAKDARAFVEHVVHEGRPELVAEWREELEVACALAVAAYERVRGNGPSVVPSDDVDDQ
jgi:hypothetical protein